MRVMMMVMGLAAMAMMMMMMMFETKSDNCHFWSLALGQPLC